MKSLLTCADAFCDKDNLVEVDLVRRGSLLHYTDFSIFKRNSIIAIVHICYGNSISLSIHPSVTHMHCIKTAEHIIEILSLSDRTIILIFRR